ncbi:MAG: FAD:protein FMN transferase [Clostridia bacterium]|nr:FAD:protein FMN transferase [Clostridia bacterium]
MLIKSRIIGVLMAYLCLFCMIFGGCEGINPHSRLGYYMDTVISITLYGDEYGCSLLIEECMDICGEYDRRLSLSRYEYSEISMLNAGLSKTVSLETAELISRAIGYSKLSGGAFDISIAPISRLWNFTSKNPTIPDDELINSAVGKVDYTAITVDGERIDFSVEGMQLDLGGIAKGFVADKIREHLISSGVTSGIIDLGGNVVLIGAKPSGEPYLVGIKDPNGGGEPVCLLEVTDAAVVTSGTYERMFIYEGKKYHHILDANTGYPSDTDIVSATIITKSAEKADALSTICVLLGSEGAEELLFEVDDVCAVFILEDGSIRYINGAEELIRN